VGDNVDFIGLGLIQNAQNFAPQIGRSVTDMAGKVDVSGMGIEIMTAEMGANAFEVVKAVECGSPIYQQQVETVEQGFGQKVEAGNAVGKDDRVFLGHIILENLTIKSAKGTKIIDSWQTSQVFSIMLMIIPEVGDFLLIGFARACIFR
jgi:hypothetical protein